MPEVAGAHGVTAALASSWTDVPAGVEVPFQDHARGRDLAEAAEPSGQVRAAQLRTGATVSLVQTALRLMMLYVKAAEELATSCH